MSIYKMALYIFVIFDLFLKFYHQSLLHSSLQLLSLRNYIADDPFAELLDENKIVSLNAYLI